MYSYTDNNRNDDISLHDCRATEITVKEGYLSFLFEKGFWVLESNRNNYNECISYTDKSEVKFKTLSKDTESDVTVYIFTDIKESDKSIRETLTLNSLKEMLDNGMELEFLYSYRGYNSYIFECWLWFDYEPYHKECVLIISAEDAVYSWNELFKEDA